MKLSPRDAGRFFESSDPGVAAVLIYGPDAMRIALKRQSLLKAVTGPAAAEEMRLTRLAASEVRSDPAALTDALKAQGFFPGPRAVFVEDATDTLAKALGSALEEWRPGDAFLLATAGQLTARSALRKLFEGATNAYAAPVYADPMSRDEVEAALRKAGLTDLPPAALTDLNAMAAALDPGDFAQMLEKLALYKLGDPEPLTADDIAAVAPATSDAAVDDAIRFVADGNVPAIGRHMARLSAQGVAPTTLCIAAARHFRQLHAASSAGTAPEEALSRLRPPVFGPRRDAMASQIRAWGQGRLERALKELMDADLALRSSTSPPQHAYLERSFIRVAMMRPNGIGG